MPNKRVTFREVERQFRGNWLPKDLGDRATRIKQLVQHLYCTKEKEIPLKHYTPHGKEHCQAVEDNLHRLIPRELHLKLSEAEKFFLISSAWLHDIGMLRGITTEDDLLDDDEIREFHHIRSEEFMANRYDEVGILEEEASACGLLAKFHRRRCEITECPSYMTIPNHGTVRLRLIAAYLRLADALHIDQSRAPDKQYAISLAYNIPYKSKLHWYRSKFVLGVEVNVESKEIIVHLKYPTNKKNNLSSNEGLDTTYNSIYELIIQDLADELNSLKNVLFEENISYFLDIRKEIHQVEVDKKFSKDINPILNYYHLLDNPSSSALLTLVLGSIKGIIESNLNYPQNCGENSTRHCEDEKLSATLSVRKTLSAFLTEIKDNVIESRKCHIGLASLIDEIDDQIKYNDVKQLHCWINKKSDEVNNNRRGVRLSASRYFKSISNDFRPVNKKETEENKINILVYGYSELVMKTLCGFRDAIIDDKILSYAKNINSSSDFDSTDTQFFHKVDFENLASSYFRIFCCEGQPKNHTTWSGRFHHHDGSRYALALAKRGFNEIYIIPDAVATSLVAPSVQSDSFPKIHFVIIGANGFDDSRFRHSAGHSMVVAACCFAANNSIDMKQSDSPRLILSLMTDKYRNDKRDEFKCKYSKKINMIEGWSFRSSFSNEPVRQHSFFTQDPELKKDLSKYNSSIHLYNPREDNINIKFVDVIISESFFLDKEKIPDSKTTWIGKNIANAKSDNKLFSEYVGGEQGAALDGDSAALHPRQ